MIPLVCVSYTCPDREACSWRQHTFAQVKAAHAAGRSRFCDQPGEICPFTLNRALHSFSGARERWEQRRATGMTDADLAWAIGKEFGEWGQHSDGPGNTHMGKCKDPKIWFGRRVGDDGKTRKPDLEGKALVAAVRDLLSIPLPLKHEESVCEISQVEVSEAPAPWAGLPMFSGGAHA